MFFLDWQRWFQLLSIKRGGKVIFFGPLGHNSHNVFKYFKVTTWYIIIIIRKKNSFAQNTTNLMPKCELIFLFSSQQFAGYSRSIKDKNKYNPTTWMLEVSSTATEHGLGIKFLEHYKKFSLYNLSIKVTNIFPPKLLSL